jgi:nicotinate-nucleotide adenylyltransferase
VSSACRRLGIFGGTFDPVHLGHLILVSELRVALGLDRVLLVPNARSPFKTDQEISSEADRVAMLALAVTGTPWLDVSTIELDRGGVSYTIDTLEELHHQDPGAKLFFLMGADSLVDLPSWRHPDGILALAEIAVATRPGISPDVASVQSALPTAKDRIHVIETPLIALSSTGIRGRVRGGKPITFLVPASVERYITEHGLYGNFPTDKQSPGRSLTPNS